jgi:hypothetical protein
MEKESNMEAMDSCEFRRMKNLSFGEAFDIIAKSALNDRENAKGMRLPSWSEEVVVKAHYPMPGEAVVSAPFLFVKSRFGTAVWKENMVELFSNAWEIVE